MPIHTVHLKPGIDVEQSMLLNQLGWSQSQWIRWREGLPEKRGGFVHINPIPFTGVARGMKIWSDLSGNPYIGIGTDQRLQIFFEGAITDITPTAAVSNLSNAFSTSSGQPTVTVLDPSYFPEVGSWINIVNATYIGGIVLQGLYRVTAIGTNSYSFNSGTNATATVNGGGTTFLFNASVGSSFTQITLGAFTFTSGQVITLGVATSVDGFVLSPGKYTVNIGNGQNGTPIGPYIVTSSATSTAQASENGGETEIQYLVPSALITSTQTESGYGIGIYGTGIYGISQTANITARGSTQATAIPNWALDRWGGSLIGNFTGSTIYIWNPPISVGNIAVPTGGSTPTAVNWSFVAMPQQIVVGLGTSPAAGGTQDPNLVSWSDAADFTDWLPTIANQAGSFRIPTGSRIVGGLQGPNFGAIWTDVDFWLMQYLGQPFVFGFTKIAHGVELLAPRAAGILNGMVFWASNDNFFIFNGNSVQVIPCTVWDKFFKNINTNQVNKVHCATNSHFQEVMWYYPSLNSTEIDSYVCYNIVENAWDYGLMPRTAWSDDNELGPPIGCDLNGLLQQHDIEGIYDGDGTAIASSIESGFMALSDGTLQIFVERLIPDLILTGGSQRIFLTLLVQNYPSDTIYSVTLPVTPLVPYLIMRLRGRVAAIKIQSIDAGVFWRLGAVRYLAQQAGRR